MHSFIHVSLQISMQTQFSVMLKETTEEKNIRYNFLKYLETVLYNISESKSRYLFFILSFKSIVEKKKLIE